MIDWWRRGRVVVVVHVAFHLPISFSHGENGGAGGAGEQRRAVGRGGESGSKEERLAEGQCVRHPAMDGNGSGMAWCGHCGGAAWLA